MKYLKNFSYFDREINESLDDDTKMGDLTTMKLVPSISHTKLQDIQPSTATVKTNQNILNQLQSKKLIADPRQLNFNVNDKDFLSKISQYIQSKGFTPYLNVSTDQVGNSQSVNTGITFSVPKLGVDLSFERGYFGVSKELPFLNGATATASYTSGDKGDDYYGTGYKSTLSNNSSYTLNNRFGVGLSIPIGK